MRKILSFFISFVILAHSSINLSAQISGIVTGTSGDTLAFATVYLEGTSTGVSTNLEGKYEFSPPGYGSYNVVCQFLGYRTQIQTVDYRGSMRLDFELEEESILAPTVEINANAEDPAYAIIREAIKKRKYHKDKIKSLSCESYIKGRFDLEKVPEMFLNSFMEEMDIFDVDSTGKGIIYLSESESSFHKTPPDKVKEVMHSSLVSGFDNQFSFNNALSTDFSIYDNQLEIVRNIVSPIANSALFYYKYRLIGTTIDEKGRLVNKIKVIPKSKTSPTFAGIIYVIEDKWSVPQGELVLTSNHVQQSVIDSIRFVFSSVEVEEDTWVDIKKDFWMRIKVFGFAASGGFHGVFSNYRMNPEFEDGFFGREIFKVEEEANEKSEQYWDSIRPLPLTSREEVNYVRMDSLKVIRKKKLDSLVNFPPAFKPMDVIGGYFRYLDSGRLQLNYEPLAPSGFNVVQGAYLGVGADLNTHPDSVHIPGWGVGGDISYSFAEKRLRGGAYYTRFANNDNDTRWTIEAGRFISEFREPTPIHPLGNTFYSLLKEENYAKYYDQSVVAAEISNDWLSGIKLRNYIEYARRKALTNNSDYSWAKAEDIYESNNPQDPLDYSPAFEDNDHIVVGFDMDITFGQRYISYPNRIFRIGSKYPNLHFNAALDYNFESEQAFVHLQGGVSDTYDWNVAGDGAWNVGIGSFLFNDPVYFTDYKHFDGNEIVFGDPETYLRSYMMLPYYEYSTNGTYIEAHFQHHFRGFIMDKIPLIRRLKWNLAAGANYLKTNELSHYAEIFTGIENIGVGFVRFLRFDVVFGFDDDGYRDTDYLIGLDLGSFLTSTRRGNRRVRTSF